MAGEFDDLIPRAAPRGAFDDLIPGQAPKTWGQWGRSLFTGEGRTEFPDAEEFHVALLRAQSAGLTPEQVQAQPRGRDPQTFWEHVRRALGSAEFDAPSAPPGQGFDPSAIDRAAITPDPAAQVDILRRNIPGLETRPDRYGNVMVRAPSIGVESWTYLNRPGMSARDWHEIATQTLATAPLGAAVGLGRNLVGRAVIGGAALGGASLAQDAAAITMGSEQGFDPTRAAVSAGFGAVAGPVAGWLANRAARAPTPLAAQRAAEIGEDAAAHTRLEVRPFGPGFNQGPVASVARQLAETPVVGSPVRRALEESVSETARAAGGIAGRFGAAATADEAGLVAREGLNRFRNARADIAGGAQRIAQERGVPLPANAAGQRALVISAPAAATSLKTRQAALYDQAWALVPADMQAGRAVKGMPRVLGAMSQTRAALDDIAQRNTRMTNSQSGAVEAGTGRTLPGGFLGQVIEAVRDPDWRAALQTMRDIRSDFRRIQSGIAQTEGAVLRHSDIDRIESAITRDMVDLLQRNINRYTQVGQPQVAASIRRAIYEFRRADRYTRQAMRGMEIIERIFDADNATALYRNIAQAALGGTRGDVNKLRVLARTLRRDEMNEIASYVLRAMGEPVASAKGFVQQIGFSPSSFMTRFGNMQPEARNIIFGRQHAQALDDLRRVANRLSNVEGLVNSSRSGTNTINTGLLLGTGGAIWAGFDAFMTGLASASGAFAASVLFSRPAYVRWVQNYLQLRAAVQRAPQRMGPALTAHVARLGSMAASDPALLPIVRSLRMGQPIGEEHGGNPNPNKAAPPPQ
jgi:hypothetical protein